jgi:hypothetical protein
VEISDERERRKCVPLSLPSDSRDSSVPRLRYVASNALETIVIIQPPAVWNYQISNLKWELFGPLSIHTLAFH